MCTNLEVFSSVSMRTAHLVLLLTLAFCGNALHAQQNAPEITPQVEPTIVEVRVVSLGAKFIGTSMGGAHVTIRDKLSGELLAQGLTAGSTGDTKKIMSACPRQGDDMSTPDAATFRAELRLREPRLVEVTAQGPMAQLQSSTTVSQTQFVVPGKDITGGDAWLLELRGLVVDVLYPPTHIKLQDTPQEVDLQANVTMLCGCPISPDAPWKPEEFEVTALLKRNGQQLRSVPLAYTGEDSQFAATLQLDEPGTYEATVYAYRPSDGNTGLDHVTFIISEAEE